MFSSVKHQLTKHHKVKIKAIKYKEGSYLLTSANSGKGVMDKLTKLEEAAHGEIINPKKNFKLIKSITDIPLNRNTQLIKKNSTIIDFFWMIIARQGINIHVNTTSIPATKKGRPEAALIPNH